MNFTVWSHADSYFHAWRPHDRSEVDRSPSDNRRSCSPWRCGRFHRGFQESSGVLLFVPATRMLFSKVNVLFLGCLNSVAVSVNSSVRLPGKLIAFTIRQYFFWRRVSQTCFIWFWKQNHCTSTCQNVCFYVIKVNTLQSDLPNVLAETEALVTTSDLTNDFVFKYW